MSDCKICLYNTAEYSAFCQRNLEIYEANNCHEHTTEVNQKCTSCGKQLNHHEVFMFNDLCAVCQIDFN